MRKLISLGILLAAALPKPLFASSQGGGVSNLKSDETLVFFRTSAWLNENGTHWRVPIHGWVYEPQNSRLRKASAAKLIQQRFDLSTSKDTQANFDERVNLLLSDNERGKSIVITAAGRNYTLPPSSANGHFQTTIDIPLDSAGQKNNGRFKFTAVLDQNDERIFTGESILVAPTGRSIISDIDDTVKLSFVTDRKQLVDATFFQDFAAVPGMANHYRKLGLAGAQLHFVSSSPWQLYTPLEKFLTESGFQTSTMSLKSIRFRDKTILNLFKKGTATKPQAIAEIIDRYPARTFTLIGDSGEQDPEVYAQIAARYPGQIDAILIRNIDQNESLETRLTRLYKDMPGLIWSSFSDASEITLKNQ